MGPTRAPRILGWESHPTWETNISPRERRGALLPTLQMFWPVHLWDLLVLEAIWPMEALAPHVGFEERA